MPTWEDYADFAKQGAAHYNLDPEMVLALFEHESKWDPNAVSVKGARGIGQLMPGTAEELGVKNPHDPWANMDASMRYLRKQMNLFNNDPVKALAAYNAGGGAVLQAKDKERGIPSYAAEYVDTVLGRSQQIKQQKEQAGIAGGETGATLGFSGPMGVFPPISRQPGGPEKSESKDLMGIPGPETLGTDLNLQALPKGMLGGFLAGSGAQLKGLAADMQDMRSAVQVPENEYTRRAEQNVLGQMQYEPIDYSKFRLGEPDTYPKRLGIAYTPIVPKSMEEEPVYKAGSSLANLGQKIPMTPAESASLAGQTGTGAGSLLSLLWPFIVPGIKNIGFSREVALPDSVRAAYQSVITGEKFLSDLPLATQKIITRAQTLLQTGEVAGLAGLQGVGTGYDLARQYLGSEEAKDAAQLHGTADYLMMGIPVSRAFKSLNAAMGGRAGATIRQMITGAVEFPTFMAGMEILSNAVAKLKYDEQRELLQGVGEGTPAQVILGAALAGAGAIGGFVQRAKTGNRIREAYDKIHEILETTRTEPGGKEYEDWLDTVDKNLPEYQYDENGNPIAPGVPAAKEVAPTTPTPTPAPVDRRADFEKALQKKHSNIGSASGAVAHWKKEGFDVRYERDPQTGKYFLVENEKTPEAPTFADEFKQNEEATAGEGLADSYKTAEVLSDAMERDIQEKMAATGLPRHKFDFMAPAPEAKKAAKKEEPIAPTTEEPPPPSGKPITKGEEVLSEAEQAAIDDKIVELREDKKKSFVEISKTVGLSMAETKARYKYATGKTEKAPYEVGGTEEEAPREAPVIQTELPTELPRGTEAPKEKEAPPPTKALPTKVTKSASGEPFRSSFQARGALAELREKGLIAPEKGNIEQIPGTQFWQIDTKKGGVSLFTFSPIQIMRKDSLARSVEQLFGGKGRLYDTLGGVQEGWPSAEKVLSIFPNLRGLGYDEFANQPWGVRYAIDSSILHKPYKDISALTKYWPDIVELESLYSFLLALERQKYRIKPDPTPDIVGVLPPRLRDWLYEKFGRDVPIIEKELTQERIGTATYEGINYTDTAAIPHELGHFLYARMQTSPRLEILKAAIKDVQRAGGDTTALAHSIGLSSGIEHSVHEIVAHTLGYDLLKHLPRDVITELGTSIQDLYRNFSTKAVSNTYQVSKDLLSPSTVSLYTFSPFAMKNDRWFSKLQEAVSTDYTNWPKKMNGSDALQRLQKLIPQKKAKKEEYDDVMRLTGLKQRLEEMKGATRDQILDEIMSSGIEVEERWLTSVPQSELNAQALAAYRKSMEDTAHMYGPGEIERYMEYAKSDPEGFIPTEIWDKIKVTAPKYENTFNYNLAGPREGYVELVLWSPQAGEMREDPNHFLEGPGKRQIGWVRGDWRRDADGKKVFFIEEVQEKRVTAARDARTKEIGRLMEGEGLSKEEAEKRVPKDFGYGEIVPDAPFRDSWLRLLSRRILKYAAENGADKVAWTTGEQQAERWSLRHVADELQYSDGVLYVIKERRPPQDLRVAPSDLKDYIGGDLAKELIDQANTDPTGTGQVRVPEGIEFYSSKWPEKIYGFARGGYEKSLLATAMKEAMGQFKGKVGEVTDKRILGIQKIPADPPTRTWDAWVVADAVTKERYSHWFRDVADAEAKLAELQQEATRLTEFSRQPAVDITPEAREFWTNNPMALYTFSPFTFKKRNIGETRNVLFTNLGKEGEPLTEILRGYVTDDISRLTKIASLTQWLVEENPRLRPIFETVMSRLETAQTLLHSYLDPWAKDYTALPKESQEALTSFFNWMDERPYKDVLDAAGNVLKKGMGVEAPKYLPVEGSKKGMLQLNPEHYEQWKNAVRTEGNLPEDLIDLAAQMRKSMDQALIDMWNLDRGFFKPGSVGLKTLKNAVYEIDNYFPHIRQGDWVLEALEIDHKTGGFKEKPLVSYAFNLLPGMFDVQKWAGRGEEPPPWIEKWARNKFAKEVNENPFTAGKDHIWKLKRHAADPVQMYGSQPILVMALQDMVNRAATSQQAGFSQQYANVLNKSLADVLKKTGEWGHFAHRSGIPGHDVSDVGKVFYNYFSGFSNIRAKAHMVKDLAELARQVDVNRPQETAWAAKYMDHMLDPNRDVSALMHGLRQLAYYNYLNPARFFFVNLTNAITAGSPTLGVYTGIGTADKYLMKSIARTAAWQAGRGTEFKRGNAPDTDLVRLMKELYDDGTTRAQFLETIGQELMQEPGSGKMRQYYEGAKNVLSWPAKTSEILSRVATAMAAFDAYRDGKVKGTEKIDGTMSEEQFQEAKAFAADIVDKSHSIWSEVNRPEWARGSGTGRLLSSALIFKHYQQHVLQMWKWMWDQGPQGKAALGRSILSQFLLGGVVGIPLAQTLRSFYQSMFDEDPWIQAKKGTGGFLGDWFFYGAPASMGLPIHTSFETDLPMKFEDLLGVPASLVRQGQEAIKSAKLHDWQRAAENAIPVKVIRDILQGQRLYSRGATTSGGQPIGTLERPTEPQKIGLGELAMKTLGFPPMSVTKLRDVREVERSLQEKRQAMEQELGTRYVNALRAQDQAGMAAVREEANAWNQKYLAKRQPQYVIRLKDAIQSRMRPALPPKAMRGTAREMENTWLK